MQRGECHGYRQLDVISRRRGCGRTRASLDSFTVYVVQHRDSTAAAMYAENATFMPPNQGMVQGRAAILAWMKTVPPMSHFTASAIDINGRGDLAYVRGTYQVVYL